MGKSESLWKTFMEVPLTFLLRSKTSWYRFMGNTKWLTGITVSHDFYSVYIWHRQTAVNGDILNFDCIHPVHFICPQRSVINSSRAADLYRCRIYESLAMFYPLWWWSYGKNGSIINDLEKLFSLFAYLFYDSVTSAPSIGCLLKNFLVC